MKDGVGKGDLERGPFEDDQEPAAYTSGGGSREGDHPVPRLLRREGGESLAELRKRGQASLQVLLDQVRSLLHIDAFLIFMISFRSALLCLICISQLSVLFQVGVTALTIYKAEYVKI